VTELRPINDKCTFWGQYTANSTDPIQFVIGG